VTAIQRFGGSANLNVHSHALLFDGVYTRASATARPVFHRLPPPTDADIAALLARVQRRVERLVVRRGRGVGCGVGERSVRGAGAAEKLPPASSGRSRVCSGPSCAVSSRWALASDSDAEAGTRRFPRWATHCAPSREWVQCHPHHGTKRAGY
jgi:hypothetical protein